VADDDWRVEVELEEERHGGALGDRLRRHDLDDEARKRLQGRLAVTKDGPRVFLYAKTEEQAQEAERVVRDLLEAEGRRARVRVARWHPDAEEWMSAAIPLPQTEEQRAAERERLVAAEEMEAQADGAYDWEVAVDMPSRGEAVALERALEADGRPVERHWRFLAVGAPTEEEAEELAEELRGRVPDDADIRVQGNPDDLPRRASFVLFGFWNPL
jgi:hypothetical protein